MVVIGIFYWETSAGYIEKERFAFFGRLPATGVYDKIPFIVFTGYVAPGTNFFSTELWLGYFLIQPIDVNFTSMIFNPFRVAGNGCTLTSNSIGGHQHLTHPG